MTTASKKVSVIIPSFNRSGLVLDAIQSVADQKYKPLEILVIDDGSTDDTREKLAPLAETGVIRFVHQQNGGRSAARNKGISLATGDFIAFLDSDDLFEPGKLARQIDFFAEHPEVGLVHGGYVKFDESGKDLGYRDTSWFSGWIYPRMLLVWYTLMATPTVMVRRSVLEAVGGFDESLFIAEDLDLWRRIARKYPFGYIYRSLARIRIHADNISKDALSATREFERYLGKAFQEDPSLSSRFQNRVYSRLYSNQAYMMLSDRGTQQMSAARTSAKRAIYLDPLNASGYMAFLSTAISDEWRGKLVERWRALRSWLMALNRKA